MMTSRSDIEPVVTKHMDFGSRGKGKYFCVKIRQTSSTLL